MKKELIYLLLVMTFNGVTYAGGGHSHGHHDNEHEVEVQKGAHGGRLLSDGDFSLEVTIYEDDVPPQYRIFCYKNNKIIDPESLKVEISLERFGGKQDVFQLFPKAEYLTSEKIVNEPHSFEVTVDAEYQGKSYKWHYESFEGRTILTKEAFESSDIEISQVAERELSHSVTAYGRILADENRVAHLMPRFPGIIKEIPHSLGETVTKGDILAVVESNQSLATYQIKAPMDGVIIKRHGTLGEFVSESQEIFVLVDLSTVWADFQIYRDDFDSIKAGQEIVINLGDNNQRINAKVQYVSPITDEATQSKLVRAVLPNPNGTLRPGLFISSDIIASHEKVSMAVKREAIQRFRDWNVIYLTDGEVFQAMPVELGKNDKNFVEILSGVELGDRYVSKNSFLIKADIEKSGATHDH